MRLPIAVLFACIVALAGISQAELTFGGTWNEVPNVVNDTGITNGMDIIAIKWGEWKPDNSDYWYFRLELEGTPSPTTSSIWAVYIDSKSGGVDAGASASGWAVPTGDISGVDYILDSHNASNNGNWDLGHFHEPPSQTTEYGSESDTSQWNTSSINSSILDWRILKESITGTPINIWAATLTDVSGTYTTIDLEPTLTPEPGTMLLALISALLGFAARIRSRRIVAA